MPLLEISDLKKSFRTPEGETQAVLDVPSFSLKTGQQVALRGASGTGKTTLLNCIAGILSPTSGIVRLDGYDFAIKGTRDGYDLAIASEPQRDALRARCIGYIFQTFNLLQGYTCMENVLLGMSFGRGPDTDAARGLLDRVGLNHRLHHRPGQLSVGQQQRVAVARALANQPLLVLADEPTGNLDPRNAREALQLIREVCEETNAALLIVSHDPMVLDQFDDCQDLAELNHAAQEVAV